MMRYPSIDILRTFAIIVMVLVHFGENLSGYHSPITGFGAPLFAFLAGVSYCLWSRAQSEMGKSGTVISQISVRRALFVFGVGLIFNVLVWLPGDLFNWDVLTFIGAALLFLAVTRHLPMEVLMVISIACLLASPVLQEIVDYDSYWQNYYFDPEMTLADLLIGFLVAGYFPFLPWIVFPVAGYQAGAILFTGTGDSSNSQKSRRLIVITGMSLFVASISLLCVRPYLPTMLSRQFLRGWTMFPPSIEYVTCTLGLNLILLGVIHRYVDLNPAIARYQVALQTFRGFSSYSFSIYVLHHVVHVWPLWLYAMTTGKETTDVWMKAIPLTASIPLAIMFLLFLYGFVRLLGHERNYGIEFCMRWLCD